MPRTKRQSSADTFIVVVSFPSSSKEYHYLCADPLVRQGSTVIANGSRVKVIRTAPWVEGLAYKYVQSDHATTQRERRRVIAAQLKELIAQDEFLARAAKLKSPEAKRLVAELKELCK